MSQKHLWNSIKDPEQLKRNLYEQYNFSMEISGTKFIHERQIVIENVIKCSKQLKSNQRAITEKIHK